MDYLKLGSPQKGIPFLQQALKLDASNMRAHEALAAAYLGQEDFRSAAEQFRQIAELDSDKPEAWFKLGHQYPDLAARLAYRGAHLYRESAWGHRFLGDLLFQRSRWDDALKEYEKALSLDPQQPGLHTSLGQTYLHAQKLEETEREFRLEIQLDSANEPAWLGLASVQLARNQARAALEAVEKVWKISPEFLEAPREFPSIDLAQETAKSSITSLRDEPAAPAKHFMLASLCAVTNERTCADDEWKSFKGDVAAWRQTLEADKAVQSIQDPCKSHVYSPCIDSLQSKKNLTGGERLLLGKAHFSLQQFDLAANFLSEVQGVNKDNAEASYWLARTYQALGADAYARLQESFPDSWRACQMRAEGAALRGNFDDALKEFHAALQLRPEEPELHEVLGELYLNQHLDEAASQSELEKALELDPGRAHTLYLLGLLFVQKKDNEKALPYLQRALRLQPDLVEANSLLGTAYVRLGQFENAVPRLEKAAPSDHYGNVHYQLYLAYRKLGRSELAQKELALSRDLRRSYLERDEALIMGTAQPEPEPQ
jgi:tetratricopeptide (TPR) repeat protein